ncbi:MAG TPA: glucose PTS transporter subunit IIA, partial [Niallia sp.]|nr:glucose PTS transporter subunit IIA [Niallia sp.]
FNQNDGLLGKILDVISSVFAPMVGAMAGAGILKGLLTIALASGILSKEDGAYLVLYAASDSLFYFLPLILAFTSARKFKADPFVAVVIAGALIYPDLIHAYENGTNLDFFGIPILLTNYSSSVIPIILAVFCMSKIQHTLNNWLHAAIRPFFTPMLLISIMVPLTLLVLGPIGNHVSDWLASVYKWIYDGSTILAGAFLGAFWQVLVIFGLHWGIAPIATNNLSKFGYDTLAVMVTPAIFAQAGAALGVWLKVKKKEVKSIAASASLAGIFGVTEPAIYGINLRYKKPFIIGCISGGIGGALAGYSGAKASGLSLPGLASLPVFFGEGFVTFLISILLAFILAALLTYSLGFDRNEDKEDSTFTIPNKGTETNKIVNGISIQSPFHGALIPLSEVPDPVFASEAIGKGVAIIPVDGLIYAPITGTVSTVFPTGHSIGFLSKDGVEILIHIGIDTVQLDGKFFEVFVKEGQPITQGELLGQFDIQAITSAGFSIITPVIVTNYFDYLDVIHVEVENVEVEDPIFTIIK